MRASKRSRSPKIISPVAAAAQAVTIQVDTIDPSPTNRQIDEAGLPDLADSIKAHGLLQPIGVRPINGSGRFQIVYGERRWRASILAGLTTIDAFVRPFSDAEAKEAQLIENIQHERLHPMDEADAYQALLDLDPAYTPKTVALCVGRSQSHVYQRLTYRRLIPEVAAAFRDGTLPPDYADRIARVPAPQQAEALRRCFFPVLGGTTSNELDPLALASLRQLDVWIAENVRLNPRDEDAKVFLPELAEEVAEAESAKGATILALSTHTYHVKTDASGAPKPILALSWRKSEGNERCKHAQLGVVVIGPGRGTTLHVCIAKRECAKHFPRTATANKTAKAPDSAQRAAAEEKHKEEAERRQRQQVWRTDHYVPKVIAEIATKAKNKKLTPQLLMRLIETDEKTLEQYVGPLTSLPAHRLAQLCFVALAIDSSHGWSDNQLTALAKECGVNTKVVHRRLLKAHPPDKIVLPAAS